ncbi:hypothetical protein AOQ84DRAFT_323635 [Glonium stellatum]|uniref:Prolyl 4-hydroxylase alpha subunit domain-containing protein n=1 Tax=Glonium stellatum TaxID=574774 RepID=A0A8E2EUR0_9PEZI|nr:hypothetical protein AOQ84DRAFT_323635 [Glonium stellatum]
MVLKLSTTVQYLFIGAIGYILAGAPLSRSLFGPSKQNPPEEISSEKSASLVIPEDNLTCPYHAYNIHIFSRDPLIIYIQSFLSNEEAEHIVSMSEDKFKPSTVWTEGTERLDATIRKSEKALLDRDDIVKCIEHRARVFQGWRPDVFIEKLWSQRYTQNGHYRHHYDWSSASSRSGRISSFMVYLEANCTGGGTNFPRLEVPQGGNWCEFMECDGKNSQEGVTFKPLKGNAIFWENFRADGTGYKECWHAGLPVLSGTKIGLNIWSWYQKGYRPDTAM